MRQWETSRFPYDFHMTLCLWGFNIQMTLDHICLLNIFLMYAFELIWLCLVMPDQTQLICDSLTKKSSSYLNWFLRYWNFRNPPQSDWSQAFWAITQDLEFCHAWNSEWEVKYHDNSPFRLFWGKQNHKTF